MTTHDDPPKRARGPASGEQRPSASRDWPNTQQFQMRVARADNGFEEPLDELLGDGGQPLLWSVGERLRLVRRSVTGSVSIRRRDVLRLSLGSGRQLDLTPEHQILKVDGWAPATQLTRDSRIAAVRRLGEPDQPQWMHDSEVILLAHMIGDGSCVKRQRSVTHPSMRRTSWR